MAQPPPIPPTAPKPAASHPGAPAGQQPTPGRVVLYGFKNPVNGDVAERPAMVVRSLGEACQLAVMVDGASDFPLLTAAERDALCPRATVWRPGVLPTKTGNAEAYAWRWPPR